jgi:hypothetical protein
MWSWSDKFWDVCESLGSLEESRNFMNAISKPIFQWILKHRAPQSADENIAFLIRKIRHDVTLKSLFLDLIYGRQGQLPFIMSIWRPGGPTQLLYIGQTKPTEDEQNEKTALNWILSRGLAEPVHDPTSIHETQHYYFLTTFGTKVRAKYEAMYSHEKRNC